MNLLTNAVKYGSDEPIDIGIRKSGSFAEIEFKNSGKGIAKEDQSKELFLKKTSVASV